MPAPITAPLVPAPTTRRNAEMDIQTGPPEAGGPIPLESRKRYPGPTGVSLARLDCLRSEKMAMAPETGPVGLGAADTGAVEYGIEERLANNVTQRC